MQDNTDKQLEEAIKNESGDVAEVDTEEPKKRENVVRYGR